MTQAVHDHRAGGAREMFSVAMPMVVSMACDTVMMFTDRLFLSRVAPELMNAALGGGMAVFMMWSFVMGLVGYTTALVAQHLGAGRPKDCPVILTQALLISAGAYPLICASGPLAEGLFTLMDVPASQLAPQVAYFRILLFGVILSLARHAFSGFFSGIGRTGVVMGASITAMIANAALNYVLIFGKFGAPAMGIRGAAYGTLGATAVGVAVMAAVYLSPSVRRTYDVARSFRFDRVMIGRLMRFGAPAGVEHALAIVAFNIMILAFHGEGPVTATAATVVLNWDMVSFVPLIGIEVGVTSLVGRFMGAGRPDLAHRAAMSGLKLGLMYSASVLILFAGFPGPLVDVFRPEGAADVFGSARPLAVFMVRTASLYVLLQAVIITFMGALRGAGDTVWAMGISIFMHWLIVGALFVILRLFDGSAEAGWLAVVFLVWIPAAAIVLRYRGGRWRSIKVVHEPDPVVHDVVP